MSGESYLSYYPKNEKGVYSDSQNLSDKVASIEENECWELALIMNAGGYTEGSPTEGVYRIMFSDETAWKIYCYLRKKYEARAEYYKQQAELLLNPLEDKRVPEGEEP